MTGMFKMAGAMVLAVFGYKTACACLAKAKCVNNEKCGDDSVNFDAEYDKISHNPAYVVIGWKRPDNKKSDDKTE